VQQQQQTPAQLIAQRAVGLFPLPDFTQPVRQLPSAEIRIGIKERTKEGNVGNTNLSAAIPERSTVHGSSVTEPDSERKHYSAHPTPHRSCRRIGITRGDQQLCLI
jgi:hypothetical protein